MKKVWGVAFGSLLVVIFLFFQGCGDTNVFDGMSDDGGDAARIEQIKQDLNSGNFDAVIAALGGRTGLTEQERRYLASAYMGRAGFDTLKLLEEFAKEDETDSDDVDAFDAIAGVFGNDVDPNQFDYKLKQVGEALEVLKDPQLNRASGQDRYLDSSASDDIRLQRGIYAAIHIILNICLAIHDAYYPELHYIPMTSEGIRAALNGNYSTIEIGNDSLLQFLNDDLAMVQDGVAALAGGNQIGQNEIEGENKNDVQRELNQFMGDIGYLPASPEDPSPNSVTADELSAYLTELILP
ncbi:MAG: hypothetical protein AB1847_19395 [bacterium]